MTKKVHRQKARKDLHGQRYVAKTQQCPRCGKPADKTSASRQVWLVCRDIEGCGWRVKLS